MLFCFFLPVVLTADRIYIAHLCSFARWLINDKKWKIADTKDEWQMWDANIEYNKKNQFQGELSIDFDLSWHNKCDIMFSVSRMYIAILNLWTILLCCALTCLILSGFFSAKAKRASARKLEEFSAAFSMLQLKFYSNVVAKWSWSRHARPSDEGQYCSCGVTELSADKKQISNSLLTAHSLYIRCCIALICWDT